MRAGVVGSLVALWCLMSGCTDVTGVNRDAAGAVSVSTPASSTIVTTAAPEPTTTITPTTTSATTTTTVPTPRRWTLLAGGDVLMDRSEPAGVDVFAGLVPSLDSADLALVNVEMAISDRGRPVDKEFVFRAPPSAAERIARAGIDVASLANNHARDYGADALADTSAHLTDVGVTAIGAGTSAAEAFRAATVEIGDVRVGVVGISFIVPGGFAASGDRSGVASGHDAERAAAAVAAAAADHDVTVAFVHWGIERETCPSDRQRAQAEVLADAGADIILGAHPHVLQPVEQLDDGTHVAWSLGNFVWHPRWGQTAETAMVEFTFDDAEVVGWSAHPHVLDDAGAPVPAPDGPRRDRILDILGGDCARHALPPLPPTTTTTAAPPTTVASVTSEPVETAPTTTVTEEPVQSLPPLPEPVTTLPPPEEG